MDVKANILTLLIFLPTIGAAATLLMRTRHAARCMALTASMLTFALSVLLLAWFDWHTGEQYAYRSSGGVVQLAGYVDWIPTFNIHYKVGLDGLSLPLVLLTTFINVIAIVASWNVTRSVGACFALLLFLETALLGVFLSMDLFLFYAFFELSLMPVYFLIGIWGGPRRQDAALKFFMYGLAGSVAMLVAVIGAWLYTHSFDMIALPMLLRERLSSGAMPPGVSRAFFLLFMVAFLIVLPAVPLHTWLPDALTEAATPVGMVLGALLVNMGGYGICRIACPLFPEAAKSLWLLFAIVGVVSILYGALCALSQNDFKRLIAYSSISQTGFVVLGAAVMSPAGFNGALFMMIAHGVTNAALVFIAGVIHDRAHHRELSRLGGLATTMPLYAGFSTIACLATLGLPGLCGFVGQVMVVLGTFQAARRDSLLSMGNFAGRGAIFTLGALACLGMLFTAGYMLLTLQRVYLGPERPESRGFAEITAREIGVLAPLAAMSVLLGILPAAFVFTFSDRTLAAMFRLFGYH